MANKVRLVSSGLWLFSNQIVSQGINFIVSIIIARLILPSEFGIIAIINVFLGLANVFVSGGFGHAIIQKTDSSIVEESSVFYFNLLFACFGTLVLFIMASTISDFYNIPILEGVIKIMSFSLIINASALIQRSLIQKSLDFKKEFLIYLISNVLSGIIGVTLAYNSQGVWSLVFLFMSREILISTLSWVFGKWRPQLVFNMNALRSLLNFSAYLMFVSLMNTAYKSVLNLVIGKAFTARWLGFYSRAETLSNYPVEINQKIISSFCLPFFSKLQNNKEELLKQVSRMHLILVSAIVPAFIFLSVITKSLIILLLTEKWLNSVEFAELLFLGGLFIPLNVFYINIINSRGKSKLYMQIDFIVKVGSVLMLIGTYLFGITTIIYGQIAVNIVAFIIYAICIEKETGYLFREQLKNLSSLLFVSTMAALFAKHLTLGLDLGDVMTILVRLLAFIVSLLLLYKILLRDKFTTISQEINLLLGTKL